MCSNNRYLINLTASVPVCVAILLLLRLCFLFTVLGAILAESRLVFFDVLLSHAAVESAGSEAQEANLTACQFSDAFIKQTQSNFIYIALFIHKNATPIKKLQNYNVNRGPHPPQKLTSWFNSSCCAILDLVAPL